MSVFWNVVTPVINNQFKFNSYQLPVTCTIWMHLPITQGWWLNHLCLNVTMQWSTLDFKTNTFSLYSFENFRQVNFPLLVLMSSVKVCRGQNWVLTYMHPFLNGGTFTRLICGAACEYTYTQWFQQNQFILQICILSNITT